MKKIGIIINQREATAASGLGHADTGRSFI